MFLEAESVYKSLIGEGNDCVIKAMVLTGGRGLGHFSNGFKVEFYIPSSLIFSISIFIILLIGRSSSVYEAGGGEGVCE